MLLEDLKHLLHVQKCSTSTKSHNGRAGLVSLGGSQGNETERPPAVSVELHPTRYRQNMTFTIDHNKSIYLIGRTFLGRINWNIYLCFCIFFSLFCNRVYCVQNVYLLLIETFCAAGWTWTWNVQFMPLAHNLGCPVRRNRKMTFLKNEKNSKNSQKAVELDFNKERSSHI